MEMVAAFGGGLFVVACLIVGGRLMWLAKSTRGLPEFVLGAGLFFMGGVGYPLLTAALHATGLSDATRSAMIYANICVTITGMWGVAWFTRRVFRPSETWATALLFGIVACYSALALFQIVGPGVMAFIDSPNSGIWSRNAAVGCVAMSWAGIESLRYYRMQRRRLALGLADAVVTERFRLWGIAILSADAITLVNVIFMLLGIPIAGTAVGSVLVGTLGLVTAGCLWLAFVPPQFYIDRIRERAQILTGHQEA